MNPFVLKAVMWLALAAFVTAVTWPFLWGPNDFVLATLGGLVFALYAWVKALVSIVAAGTWAARIPYDEPDYYEPEH